MNRCIAICKRNGQKDNKNKLSTHRHYVLRVTSVTFIEHVWPIELRDIPYVICIPVTTWYDSFCVIHIRDSLSDSRKSLDASQWRNDPQVLRERHSDSSRWFRECVPRTTAEKTNHSLLCCSFTSSLCLSGNANNLSFFLSILLCFVSGRTSEKKNT